MFDVEKIFKLTPQEFIEEGKPFTVVINWEEGDEEVSVTSHVVKEGEDYKLIIKGDYLRASSVIVTINHPTIELSVNDKLTVAFECMSIYIPKMVTDDYPESLKKVAADKKKAEAESDNEEEDYRVVCADCGEEKMCTSLQDAYDQGWFATDDGEHCPEHAEAAIEEEDNRYKTPANNCLTYN